MEKVLIIGPDFFNINDSVGKAFSTLGYETMIYNFCENYPVRAMTKVTHGLLPKLGIKRFLVGYDDTVNQEISDIFRSFKPDIVLVIKGHKIYRETLEKMKSAKLLLWMMDSVNRVQATLDNIDLFDFVFVFNEDDVDILASKGIESFPLPLALDRNRYSPVNVTNKDIDIIFIGALYPERIAILKQIIQTYPEKRILVCGPFTCWRHNLRNVGLRFGKNRRIFRVGTISSKDANLLYARSKIVLNIHNDFSLSGCNLRFFEIAGTRSVQIVNRKQIIMDEYNMEALLFDQYDDIVQIIDNIDKGIIDANRISSDVFEITANRHTFLQRVKTIIDIASG